MQSYLEALHKARPGTASLTYEDVTERARMAASFVDHPYWAIVARMLSGTIQAETEQLLGGDEHKDVNRASVAMCRKVLQMPFFDIEQGNMAELEFNKAKARLGRRSTQNEIAHREVS